MAALLGLLQAFEDLVFNVQISIDSLKIMKAHLFTNPNLRVIFSCYYLIIFSQCSKFVFYKHGYLCKGVEPQVTAGRKHQVLFNAKNVSHCNIFPTLSLVNAWVYFPRFLPSNELKPKVDMVMVETNLRKCPWPTKFQQFIMHTCFPFQIYLATRHSKLSPLICKGKINYK